MGDFTPGIAGGASVVLLGVLFTAMFKFIGLMRRRDREAIWENSELKADLQWADQQKAAMIFDLQRAGLTVPEIVWQQRPKAPTRLEEKARSE